MTLSLTVEATLDKAISAFLKEDTLEKRDQYRCENCKKQTKAKIRPELCKLPSVVVFHLKRFTYP